MNNVVAIDFDGVIHDYKHRVIGRKMGMPLPGARDAIIHLKVYRGNKVVIFTVWGGTEQGKKTIKDWMEYYQIPFDEITNIKPQADVYIDDKGLRFVDWEKTVAILGTRNFESNLKDPMSEEDKQQSNSFWGIQE